MTTVRIQQGIFIFVALLGPFLACLPRLRPWITERPIRTLAILLGLDLAYMLWATLPFLPIGVDESFFVINGWVYRGSDLYLAWMRPPVPSYGAVLVPGHPPLVGLLMKATAGALVYKLAVRALGSSWALLAVWMTLVSTGLVQFSSHMLSEPYGAAALTAFACLAARGGAAFRLGTVAAFAFLCRWLLGFLAPVAVLLGLRQGGMRGALLATVAFLLPSSLIIWVTGVEPWGMLGNRSEGYYHKSPWGTFVQFAGIGLGLGVAGMLAMLLGAFAALRARPRSPELMWCLALFAVNLALLVGMGEAIDRLLVPAVPLGCILVAAGLKFAGERGPQLLRRPLVTGLLVGAIAASVSVPVKPPKLRMKRQQSPQSVVLQHRVEILELVGRQPLYSDAHFLAVTAVLGHPVHAVTHEPNDPERNHPWGVSMDWEGKFADCTREEVPAGAFYLTYDPGGREVLWSSRELFLVRW